LQGSSRHCFYALLERKILLVKDPQAGIDDIGIIQLALVVQDFLQRHSYALGRSIGPVRGHGLDNIGD